MKDKILMLIIGALIGAVITAGCFLIFNKNTSSSNNMQGGPGGNGQSMGNFTPGEMPSGGGPNGKGESATLANTTASSSTTTTNSTTSK